MMTAIITYCSSINGNRLLGTNIRTILEIVVLPFLFSLQPKTRQPTQILLHHGLVHGTAALDALTVVVGNIRPPIGLGLDIPQYHILNWSGLCQRREVERVIKVRRGMKSCGI